MTTTEQTDRQSTTDQDDVLAAISVVTGWWL